jgi:hypothetical protein
MPPVRSLAFKYLAYHFKLIAVILSLNKIMPSYSRYTEKGLVYIAITALFSQQPSSCSEYTKSNIHSSYNIYSVSNTEYIYLTIYLYTF